MIKKLRLYHQLKELGQEEFIKLYGRKKLFYRPKLLLIWVDPPASNTWIKLSVFTCKDYYCLDYSEGETTAVKYEVSFSQVFSCKKVHRSRDFISLESAKRYFYDKIQHYEDAKTSLNKEILWTSIADLAYVRNGFTKQVFDSDLSKALGGYLNIHFVVLDLERDFAKIMKYIETNHIRPIF